MLKRRKYLKVEEAEKYFDLVLQNSHRKVCQKALPNLKFEHLYEQRFWYFPSSYSPVVNLSCIILSRM
jgi:hypothetical protein